MVDSPENPKSPPQSKNGLVEKYDEKKGFLTQKSIYKNDKLDGLSQYFYENSKIHKEINFKAGELHGPYRQYDPDGHLEIDQAYQDGTLSGPSKLYKKGILLLETNYVAGLQDGETKIYFPNGKDVNCVIAMKEGKKHGEMKVFTPTGTLIKKSMYQMDLLQGDSYSYYPDTGAMAACEKYQDDKLQGDSVKYYPNGVISEITTFDQGKPIRKPRKFKPSGAEAA